MTSSPGTYFAVIMPPEGSFDIPSLSDAICIDLDDETIGRLTISVILRSHITLLGCIS